GPTGSGKSRLLADIEWVADCDTPTERTILINDEKPDKSIRYSSSGKLVAQLSQNMNFVMDLTVEEFLDLHAQSRMVENKEETIERIIEAANHLSGEKFAWDTPITSLSGGQSRALMIADTAILSTSPIVLIDEIENAG
ncbi:MAG TPA: ABC transporter, partial [Eubacteriaceae bacterium]|nr:ABC transporter [Eubacteriaceae bacterium]